MPPVEHVPLAGRRVEILLFALAFVGFAYFHQGGGWSQNVRFALVRALIEQEAVAIDDYLVYSLRAGSDASEAAPAFTRAPLRQAAFERGGKRHALAWRDTRGQLSPIEPAGRGGAPLVAVEDVGASGDVAYHAGHFHPNKAPGTSFIAAPAYALIHAVERIFGLDVDRWSVLTINAWLTSVLSVGLVSAIGVVLLFRLARRIASERDAFLTALVFAFGTMHWPHATYLFEHNVIAIGLLAGFYLIERARDVLLAGDSGGEGGANAFLVGAGITAGWAAITNYAFTPMVAMIGVFAMVRVGTADRDSRLAATGRNSRLAATGRNSRLATVGWNSRLAWMRAMLWFGLGALVPLSLVCLYHYRCFGTPFTTNYAHQNQMFVAQSRLLGVFALPRLDVLLTLLVSPFRGIFFTSPVLVMGIVGLVLLWRGSGPRSWFWLIACAGAFPFLLNASFNGWDGGYTAVPRYVAPAVPFLALPIALVWRRWRWVTGTLATVAIAVHLLLTAVDPQVPIGDLGLAGVPPREIWHINPIGRYVLPLFVDGHPWPMIDEMIDQAVKRAERRAEATGVAPDARARQVEQLRADLRAGAERGDPSRYAMAGVVGPVSANPTGVYEGDYFRLTPAGSRMAALNSFNLGELIAPGSRWSVVPLVALGIMLAMIFRAIAGEGAHVETVDQRRGGPSAAKNG